MTSKKSDLTEKLSKVQSVDQFQAWVQHDLRCFLPHAALLCTLGNVYGVGSVPTHRISVDFPLTIVESLKNSTGALDDPLMHGWFRAGKLQYVDLGEIKQSGSRQIWRETLEYHGVRNVLIQGSLNPNKRRFTTFQFYNMRGGRSIENLELLSLLLQPMVEVVWKIVLSRCGLGEKSLSHHPTLALTATEMHIIELLAQGLSNKEIARLRGVSDSTVKTQVQRTGAKIGATRRAEIVAIALPLLSPLPPQTIIDFGEDIQ